MLDVCFVDVETTGLDPARHELLEVAAVRVSGDLRELKGGLWCQVRPTHIETAEPEALAICGYDPAKWAHADELGHTLERLARLMQGATLAGHKVDFDESFVRAGFASLGLAMPEIGHYRLDTVSLAYPLLAAGVVPDLRLTTLTNTLGIPHEHAHTAWSDVNACLELARVLAASMRFDLPFVCGCQLRFKTQAALNQHLNAAAESAADERWAEICAAENNEPQR